MLEMERKSGILIIETDTATARFFLRKGHIMRAELDGVAAGVGRDRGLRRARLERRPVRVPDRRRRWRRRDPDLDHVPAHRGGAPRRRAQGEGRRAARESRRRRRRRDHLVAHRGAARMRRLAAGSLSQAAHRAAVAHAHPEHHRDADDAVRRAARRARRRRCAPAQIIHLDRPAPIEPDVPRHFDVLYEDAEVLAIDKPAGPADAPDGEVLAQHADRAAARALPRRARADRASHRSRDLGRAAGRAHAERGELAQARVRAARRRQELSGAGQGPAARRGRDRSADQAAGHAEPRHDGAGRRRADSGDALSRRAAVRARTRCARRTPRPDGSTRSASTWRRIGHPIVGDKLYGAGEALFMRACDEGVDARAARGLRRAPAPRAARAPPDVPASAHARADHRREPARRPDLVAYMRGSDEPASASRASAVRSVRPALLRRCA